MSLPMKYPQLSSNGSVKRDLGCTSDLTSRNPFVLTAELIPLDRLHGLIYTGSPIGFIRHFPMGIPCCNVCIPQVPVVRLPNLKGGIRGLWTICLLCLDRRTFLHTSASVLWRSRISP